METVQPSPGPWIAVADPEESGAVRWHILADDPEEPWLIATIENGRPGDTLETERATAHAMAAADDLLALAYEYRDTFQKHGYCSPRYCDKAAKWTRVSKVIAKAEGRDHG